MTTETIGQRVKRLREANGLTIPDLTRKSGIAVPWIEEMEHHSRTYCSAIIPVAKTLGVSVEYLLKGEETACDWANTPGKRIRQRRDELGWSVLEARWKVFGSLGVDYCCFESDDCNNAGTFELEWTKIADALGVTLEWIKTGQGPKFPPKHAKHFLSKPSLTCAKKKGCDSEVGIIEFECKLGNAQKIAEAFIEGEAYKS